MKVRYGDMWSVPGIHVITTNSTIKHDGSLVMGKGAALAATRIYPGVAVAAGLAVSAICKSCGEYGFIPPSDTLPIGLFQVKGIYSEKARLSLIHLSTVKLADWATHTSRSIHLNYPGIGNGGLDIDVVAPIIEELPDNVYVWMHN